MRRPRGNVVRWIQDESGGRLFAREDGVVAGLDAAETVPEYAATGVDVISMGSLTHSAPAIDLSLQVD